MQANLQEKKTVYLEYLMERKATGENFRLENAQNNNWYIS